MTKTNADKLRTMCDGERFGLRLAELGRRLTSSGGA